MILWNIIKRKQGKKKTETNSDNKEQTTVFWYFKLFWRIHYGYAMES